jgi:hypothetical protein
MTENKSDTDMLIKKLVIAAIVFIGALTIFDVSGAENPTPYVDGSILFFEIEDVNRQAEAWAMCAATYDVMAEIMTSSHPARSQQLRELANGSEVAVTMAIVLDGLEPDMSQDRFNALWSMAKLASTEIPSTKRTMLAADAESIKGKEGEVFLGNLSATLEICIKNLEGQQMYIDSWRELAKSGLLKFPKE